MVHAEARFVEMDIRSEEAQGVKDAHFYIYKAIAHTLEVQMHLVWLVDFE